LLKEDQLIEATVPLLKDILVKDGRQVLTSDHSLFRTYHSENKSLTAFIELIEPAVSLVVMGAGNDVIPLVSMADILGWETTVIDGRPAYAKQERFTPSCRVLVSKPGDVISQVAIDRRTVFILMTHNYNYDMAMLKVLAEKKAVYIGMLGPKKKLARILEELKENGFNPTAEQLLAIHGPAGLDIGAESPEEIALSIIAEIKAVLAGHEGKLLKDSVETIHSRADTIIEEVKLDSKK